MITLSIDTASDWTMAGPVLSYAISVLMILSLDLSLIDCQPACIVNFSNGEMSKYGDCRQADWNNVLANIKEMAQKEAASTPKTAVTTSTRRNSPLKMPQTQVTSVNPTAPAMNMADAVTKPIAPSHSGCLIDVIFVLDGSGSFESGFNDTKLWIKSVAKNLSMRYPGVQFGVLQYSKYNSSKPMDQQAFIRTEVNLSTQKYDNFSLAVDKIKFIGSGPTYTAAALRKVSLDFGNSTNFNKTGNIQLMILITDGYASDINMLNQSAADLRKIGVIPIVVVVSEDEMSELRIIATGNVTNSERTIWIRKISGLKNLRIKWADYFGNC